MEDSEKRDYAILKSIYWKPRPWKVHRPCAISLESAVRTLKALNASKIFESQVKAKKTRKTRSGKKEYIFPFLRRNLVLCVDAWAEYEARTLQYYERRRQKSRKTDEAALRPTCSANQPVVEENESFHGLSDVEKENEDLRSDVSGPTTSTALKRWPNTIVLDSTIVDTPKASSSFDRVRSLPLVDCSPIIREVEEDEMSVVTSSSLPLTSTPAFVPARTPMLLKNLRMDAAKKRKNPGRTPPKRPKRAKLFP
ncbi:unnamed protein product [Bursaphelenchus xylophilus]|uniref:(pine wood nematode) hypothetical protein n=1 Tax=Bursaphelenchus xylophilus TaxID=6326 RepID=A0A1I7SWB1_BURXY|nr:unnamed protein product [Bursaphelenchus xylophilus]CAG9099121.1 unnamed protein product [Bursaphelenchus xylophilus]